tara:strand:+ start:5229 stop:5489 length:261 start_codon:yes stop_codon:yes gene_type:complete
MDEERKQEMIKDALVSIEHLSMLNLHVFDSATRNKVSVLLFSTITNLIFCLHKSYDEKSWNEFAELASEEGESPEEILARRKPDLN